jgi:uncharacterized lipoprotein YddW (UPF0748 family)
MASPLSLRIFLGVFLALLPASVFGQSPPKHELRGAWIATFTNIDWPSANSLSVAAQQAELLQLLDQLRATGINAVYFQVRSQWDEPKGSRAKGVMLRIVGSAH